jgi:hypothetical protein
MTGTQLPTASNAREEHLAEGVPGIVFVALAHKQTKFYGRLVQRLRERGIRSVIISLHEPSLGELRANGVETINFYEVAPDPARYSIADARQRAEAHGITNLHRLLSHEKRFYEVTDSSLLTRKLASSFDGMDEALKRARRILGDDIVLVQELGGFLSVIGAFFSAKALQIPNIFIEPSFFRGRVFFARDTFDAPRVCLTPSSDISPQVAAYIEETLQAQRIVIPHKDRAEYRHPIRKVFSAHNIRRLVEKTLQKHMRGEREEFGFISTYVRKHLLMLTRATTLRRSYREVPPGQPYLYYPLHVPGDFALTIRSPEYLDQFALIDYLARNIPPTHMLAVKEHPAMVGAFAPHRMRELLKLHDNFALIPPERNNLEVIRDAAAVITVNSKSGAEAIMLQRPVVVLGDAFYGNAPLVTKAEGISDVPEKITKALRTPPPTKTDMLAFFSQVWQQSYPGELYNDSVENCDTFASSVLDYLAAPVRAS